MKIYNSAGDLLYDIIVSDRSVRYRSIMNDDNLTLYFSLIESIEIPLHSYVIFEGVRYMLWRPEEFKKHGTRNHEYTLTLHGWREYLKIVKYKDMSSKPYRLKFTLTAKPVVFLQNLIDCLNDIDPSGGWSAGDCIDAPEKTISFNHEYCLESLGRFATEWNTEYEFEGKKVHLRRVEKFKDTPVPLSYGKGNGFRTGVGRYNDGDKSPIGRLFVQGGERNIDFSKYGSRSLLLPKASDLVVDGKTYRTDADGMFITRVGNNYQAEDSFDASEIYPKRIGTVSSVEVISEDDHFYDIIDLTIPENLDYSQQRIAGEKATIKFESGILAGREFDVEQTDESLTGYIHAERRFKIVPAEHDGYIMPGGMFVPSPGDKYAIFNISMPEAYIRNDANKTGASWDMFREGVRFFAENEQDRFKFTGELDGIYAKSKWLEIGSKLIPGSHILFSDDQFQPQGIVIRIVGVRDYVHQPHKPELTLSNAPVSGSFSSDLGKIEAEEVIRESDKKEIQRFTKRQWRDAKETMDMLNASLLNFSSSINPITVQTLQLIAGDESLQFRFVNSKTTPVRVNHSVLFNKTNKTILAAAGILQHMSIGITTVKNKHKASEYKYWDMSAYTSPPLDGSKAYYLYAKCSKTTSSGTFLLSDTAIAMDSVAGFYHLLVGILNSENQGDRSFASLYGYTEITPGRVLTNRIESEDGNTYFDLINGIIGGRIKFVSTTGETNLDDWADGTSQDIQDAQAAANAAALAAQQAINDAAANVADYNQKFANLQAQVDGEISNYSYPYKPTLSNYPASEWITNEIKDRHIGDTFFNTETFIDDTTTPDAGKAWRFLKNVTYAWAPIADSDSVKALKESSKAQAMADGKSTTFLFQPTSYKLGDMWVLNAETTINGTSYKSGEILTATQDSTSFVEAHWVKRVRYTDQDAIDKSLNDLEIGGINLLDGTSDQWTTVTTTSIPYTNNFFPNTILEAGQEYTLSFESEIVSGTPSGVVHIGCGTTDYQKDIHYSNVPIIGKRSIKFKPTSADLATHKSFAFRWYSNGEIFTFRYRKLKLEKGSKATDWDLSKKDRQDKIDAAKQEALNAASDAQTSANTAQATANALRDFTDTAFSDGVTDRAEAKSIEKYKNTLNETMAQAEASYTKVFLNPYLESGATKTALENAKINLWGKRDTLLSAINTAISGGVTTPAQKTAVDTAFANFNADMTTFQNSLEEANKDIQVKLDNIAKGYVNDLRIGGRNLFSVNNFVADNKSRGYSTISVIEHEGNIAYRSTNIVNNHNIPRYLQDKLEENTQYYFKFNILWESYTNSAAQYVFTIRYTDGSTSTIYATTSHTYRAILTSANKTINYITTSRQYSGDVIIYNIQLEKANKPSDWRPAIEDVQSDINKAMADANLARAITDKFGTDITGALISTVMVLLREAHSQANTAGFSGIQGSLLDQPSYWSGGTHVMAQAFVPFVKKLENGQTTTLAEYNNLPSIVFLHNGAAKIGHFIVLTSGEILIIDKSTGVIKLKFTPADLPAIADLVGGTNTSGSTPIGAGSATIASSHVVSGSTSVNKSGATATFNGTSIYLSARGKAQSSGMASSAEAVLYARRNGIRTHRLATALVFFTNSSYTDEIDSRTPVPNYLQLDSGTYTFELVIETIGDVINGSATTTSSNFSWEHTVAGIKMQQYAKDGMMFFFSNRHFYFNEVTGLDAKESDKTKWNTPGVLAKGRIASNGARDVVKAWGSKNSTSLVTKPSGTGSYRVPVNCPNGDYDVNISPRTANRMFYVGATTATYFDVYFQDRSGAAQDSEFSYTLVGNNY